VPRFFLTPIRIKAQLLLMRATNALPQDQREWGRAVISELNGISGFWPSLEWIAGGMTAMSKAALRNVLHNVLHDVLYNILTGAWRKQLGQEPPYATAAGIGFILLLVPFYFVSASLLNQWGITWFFAPIEHWLSRPGQAAAFNIISPVVLLGTLLCTVLLNLATLVSVGREEEGGGTVRVVKLRVRSWNLAAIGLGLLLTGVLLGYAFVENFGTQVHL
jgi:hypothetical protein